MEISACRAVGKLGIVALCHSASCYHCDRRLTGDAVCGSEASVAITVYNSVIGACHNVPVEGVADQNVVEIAGRTACAEAVGAVEYCSNCTAGYVIVRAEASVGITADNIAATVLCRGI